MPKTNPVAQTPISTPAALAPARLLIISLALAVLGQGFLIQKDLPWTLWPGLVLFGAAAFLFTKAMGRPDSAPHSDPVPWTRREGIILFLILLLAVALRTYRLDFFPTCVDMDEAAQGWGGLKISHDHWNLFAHLGEAKVLQPTFTYWAALWFYFLTPTQIHLYLFGAIVSLLAFPGIYATFRQLAGPRAALLTLFFLAVSRWHITFARAAHPAIGFLIYMFAALAFWIAAMRRGKKIFFLPAALLTAVGLYSYQAFFAFLLLLPLYVLYEFADKKGVRSWNVKPLLSTLGTAYLAVLAAGLPLLRYFRYFFQHGGFGPPIVKQPVFFHPAPNWEGFLSFFTHLLDLSLMWNRRGDLWVVHNLPGHRMLDDVTGILFVLGFFLALSRLPGRKYFYAVAGLAVMSFINFLSADPTSASRLMGALPFACFLGACALDAVGQKLGEVFPRLGPRRLGAVLALVLALAAFQNYFVYFHRQAMDPACRGMDRLRETRVGNAIQQGADGYEYYLASRFIGHYTVMFLGFPQRAHTHPLSLPEVLGVKPPEGRGLFFALEEGQVGTLHLLQFLFPGAQTEYSRNPEGRTVVYFLRVSPELARRDWPRVKRFLVSNKGLTGSYFRPEGAKQTPLLLHRDPLLNFTFRNDFPLDPAPPLAVRWDGFLEAPEAGTYRFLALTTDNAGLVLDHKVVFAGGNQDSPGIPLGKGPHRITLYFRKDSGIDTALSLLWKKPGNSNFEVVPFQYYQTAH